MTEKEQAAAPSPSAWLYWLCRDALWLYLKIFHRLRVEGAQHIPRTGGCIIAGNHVSFLDPPAMGAAVSSRPVRFMARKTLWRRGLPAWWMTRVLAIPVDRERGDVAALRRSLQVLKEGDCLGLFPEGTRSQDGDLTAAKGGIGFLIAKAGVPVVPMFIGGTFHAYPRGAKWIRPFPVRVRIGVPITPGEVEALGTGRDSFERISALVMERIRQLRDSV